jgi:hypothetical protein
MSGDSWGGPWRFDAKDPNDRSLTPPRVLPDGNPVQSASLATFSWGIVALGLLALCEGTLAWFALRWADTLGWLPESPGWAPVVGIAVAVTYLRAFDRAVFTRE